MSLERVKYFVNEMVDSINLLYKNNHYYPSVMLQYTLADTCGWLKFGETAPTKIAFKQWIKEYVLLKLYGFNFTEDDLWSHRCGLLHMFSCASRDFASNKARGIACSFKSKGLRHLTELLEKEDPEGRTVAMDAEKFKNAIVSGSATFLLELSSSSTIDKEIQERMNKLEKFILH